MALLPSGAFDLLALAAIVAGVALLVLKRDVPKAYGLGMLILGVYALDVAAILFGHPPTGRALGFVASDFLAGRAWWTPLTSMFVHSGLLHVVGNLFILVTAGPALEERIGERRFLVIYFLAGLAALAAHVVLAYTTPIVDPASIAVGASGAIFGILTAFAVRYPRERLPMTTGFFILWLPAFFVLLLYLLFNVAYLLGDWLGRPGSIAWWGHFAGFLVGLAFAATLPKVEPSGTPTGTRGLPDAGKLEPLATTPELRELLGKVRQFTPEARTRDDARFAEAWLDRFFQKAACPKCGQRFTRKGLTATCGGGETRIDFSRE